MLLNFNCIKTKIYKNTICICDRICVFVLLGSTELLSSWTVISRTTIFSLGAWSWFSCSERVFNHRWFSGNIFWIHKVWKWSINHGSRRRSLLWTLCNQRANTHTPRFNPSGSHLKIPSPYFMSLAVLELQQSNVNKLSIDTWIHEQQDP